MAKKPNRPLRPARIIEAVNAIDSAGSLFAAKADTIASLLSDAASKPEAVRELSVMLRAASEAFQAAMWPSDEGE